MHAVAPPVANVPDAHGVATLLTQAEPGGQALHTTARAADVVPAAHATGAAAAEAHDDPAGHGVQAVALDPEYSPAGHGVGGAPPGQ